MTSTRQSRQWLVVLMIVALNVLPFMPIGTSDASGDSFVSAWLKDFAFLSLPFWSVVLIVWASARRKTPGRRALMAEGIGGVLQVLMLAVFWPLPLLFVVLRAADGGLLVWMEKERIMMNTRKA